MCPELGIVSCSRTSEPFKLVSPTKLICGFKLLAGGETTIRPSQLKMALSSTIKLPSTTSMPVPDTSEKAGILTFSSTRKMFAPERPNSVGKVAPGDSVDCAVG